MDFRSKYGLGDIVFLITDKDQEPRIVVQITINQTGFQYCLKHGTVESWHFEMEVAAEKDVLKTLK
jgi:hypothetical protein